MSKLKSASLTFKRLTPSRPPVPPAPGLSLAPGLPEHWKKLQLVTLDFETFFSKDYTLKKLNLSDYVRDERFKAHMVSLKVGSSKTRLILHKDLRAELARIDWSRSMLCCHNCVPGDTEVLTPEGWQRLDSLQEGTAVMQWSPSDESMSWAVPSHIVRKHSNELLEWDTTYHQGAYTPEHRVFYQTVDTPQWRVATAQEVAARGPNNTRVPTAGILAGGLDVLTAAEARLLEAIRADGSLRAGTSAVMFRFTKQRKIQRLQALLDELRLSYRKARGGAAITLYVHACETLSRLRTWLTASKGYDMRLLQLSQAARESILDELRFWDGSASKNRDDTFSISTACPTTADTLQALAHTCGKTLRIAVRDNARGVNAHNTGARLFVGSMRNRHAAKLIKRPSVKQGDFPVFCVTVPTGAFLMRRNGAVNVTGNCAFDGLVLSHHYGIVPAVYLDTLSMARALHGNAIRADLDTVARFYGKGNKLEDVLLQSLGIDDLEAPEYAELLLKMAAYCIVDTDLCHDVFWEMAKKLPAAEFELIHQTISMFADPVLEIDTRLATEARDEEVARRETLFQRCIPDTDVADWRSQHRGKKDQELTDHQVRAKLLRKDEYLGAMLREFGVEPPKKWSAKQEKTVESFSKDLLVALQESIQPDADDGEALYDLLQARIDANSTITVTRADRLLNLGRNGWKAPIGYNYYRAVTGRWGGANKCLTGDSCILVSRSAVIQEIRLDELLPDDLVWDGAEFVGHGGLVFQGYKEVITYDGITATPDHKVYCAGETVARRLDEAAALGLTLQTPEPPIGWKADTDR